MAVVLRSTAPKTYCEVGGCYAGHGSIHGDWAVNECYPNVGEAGNGYTHGVGVEGGAYYDDCYVARRDWVTWQ